MEKIGQIICTYRKLNGISQEELAGIVGVSAGAVSKWERDIMRISRDSVTLDNGGQVPLARGKYDKINRVYIERN